MPCTTVNMGRHNRTLITNALNAADGAGLRDGALLDDIEWRAVLAALGPQRLLSSLAARASSVAPVVSTLDLPKGHHTLDDALTYLRLILAKLKVGQGRRGHARACDQQARVELPLGNGLSTFIGYDTDYLAVFTFNRTACGADGDAPTLLCESLFSFALGGGAIKATKIAGSVLSRRVTHRALLPYRWDEDLQNLMVRAIAALGGQAAVQTPLQLWNEMRATNLAGRARGRELVGAAGVLPSHVWPRFLALERGLDLHYFPGTGPGGWDFKLPTGSDLDEWLKAARYDCGGGGDGGARPRHADVARVLLSLVPYNTITKWADHPPPANPSDGNATPTVVQVNALRRLHGDQSRAVFIVHIAPSVLLYLSDVAADNGFDSFELSYSRTTPAATEFKDGFLAQRAVAAAADNDDDEWTVGGPSKTVDDVSRQRPYPLTYDEESDIFFEMCDSVSEDFTDDFSVLLDTDLSEIQNPFFQASLPRSPDRTIFRLTMPYVVRALCIRDTFLRDEWFPITAPQRGERNAPTIYLFKTGTGVPAKAGRRLSNAIKVLQDEGVEATATRLFPFFTDLLPSFKNKPSALVDWLQAGLPRTLRREH